MMYNNLADTVMKALPVAAVGAVGMEFLFFRYGFVTVSRGVTSLSPGTPRLGRIAGWTTALVATSLASNYALSRFGPGVARIDTGGTVPAPSRALLM